jgi:hypothetical protein
MVATLAVSVRAAGGGGSGPVASELTSLLTARHLDSIAAQDPDRANRFVAALLIPDAQLLVVSADYPAPAELQAQLAQKNYRDIYAALHQPGSLQTRLFFIDAGCDGLRSASENVDVMYEKGKQTTFDGRWRQQGLSESAYQKKVGDADQEYAKMLSLLVSAVKAAPAESGR